MLPPARGPPPRPSPSCAAATYRARPQNPDQLKSAVTIPCRYEPGIQRTYAEATATQQLPDWIASHTRAFAFYGGVPRAVVYDYVARHIVGVLWPRPICGRGAGR